MERICPQCGAKVKDDARFCGKCGMSLLDKKDMNQYPMTVVQHHKKRRLSKQNLIILLMILALLAIIVIGNSSSPDKQLTDVIERYVDISQSSFAELNIESELSEDNLNFLEDYIDGFNWNNCSVLLNESLQACSYEYKGLITNSGTIYFLVDGESETQGISCWMDMSYISGDDTFLTVVLDSALRAFSPNMSSEDIQNIKTHFSMQDSLVGAMTRNQYGTYEYKGNTYIVDTAENYLIFSVFDSREKYSLQGTTQGNGLTGGLPPVRFSM